MASRFPILSSCPPWAVRPARSSPLVSTATLVAAALVMLGLASCGGGGSGATASTPNSNSAISAPAVAPADDTTRRRTSIAEALYLGVPRVPADFSLDAAPGGATGPVATMHLKNTDLGATAPALRHELCTNDPAEALGWSETRALWQGSYSDLVETNDSARMFEFVRVPRADTTARLRHRVFRCTYLERAGTDLDAESGAAGRLAAVPIDVAALRAVVEYLWQFTAFNNADHVVLASSAGSITNTAAAWRIDMARLARAATATDCDLIARLAWTHELDTTSGALTRRLETLETFRARRENGVVQLCPT